WVYGAIQGFDGQVSAFNPQHNGPCYRCLYPDAPKTPVANCAEAGVIGAVAGIIGTLQALQVIQTLLGTDSFRTLEGKLWTIDTRSMETHCLRLPKKASCPLCSVKDKHSIVLAASAAAPACHAVRQYPAAGLQHTAFD